MSILLPQLICNQNLDASRSSGPLDVDPTVRAKLTLKPSHHITNFFN
jgi:hypothetical protein